MFNLPSNKISHFLIKVTCIYTLKGHVGRTSHLVQYCTTMVLHLIGIILKFTCQKSNDKIFSFFIKLKVLFSEKQDNDFFQL